MPKPHPQPNWFRWKPIKIKLQTDRACIEAGADFSGCLKAEQLAGLATRVFSTNCILKTHGHENIRPAILAFQAARPTQSRLRQAPPQDTLGNRSKRKQQNMMPYPSPDFEQKIILPERLAAILDTRPRPLVFTNGCFDILHRGHVSYLAQARALGASLLLALNTDASVRRLGKGSDRPINPLADRAAVVAALQSVSAVTWFDEDTPAALIAQVRPDVLVKGGDWQPENIVGAAETLARGGSVHSIPFLHQPSTSQTLAKIRRTEQQ